MRRFYLLAAVMTVGLIVPRPAEACSCLPSSQCQGVLYSAAVFVGRVLNIEDAKPNEPRPFLGDRRVTFSVTERFVGASDADVTVYTGRGGGDCGYPFAVGVTYLVYASRSQNGSLSTGICSRTALVGANADLKYLRALTTSPPVEARASGRAMSSGKPYKGARIFAESNDRLITAVSDADGNFELHGPPGVYRLRVEVPPTMTAWVPPEMALFDSRSCGTITVSVQVAKFR